MSTSIKISLKNKTVTTIPYTQKKQKKYQEKCNTQNEVNQLLDKEFVEDETINNQNGIYSNHSDMPQDDDNQNSNIQEEEYMEELDDEKDYVLENENEGYAESDEFSINGDYEDNVLIHREDPTIDDDDPEFDSPHISDDLLIEKDDCSQNPNFAVIVDFMERFSAYLSFKKIPIRDLQNMICDTNIEIHMDLVQLHMDLLKKIKLVKNNSKKIYITRRSWETALVLYLNGNDMVEIGTEIENDGYSRASIHVRLDILKHLMESQFEWNEPLRFLVDDLPIENLRIQPTGQDINGMTYWTQIDEVADIRIYSEDYLHNSWGNIAKTRGDLVRLMKRLKEDAMYKREVEDKKAQDEQSSILDLIVDMETEQEEMVEKFNTDYKCEVCSVQMNSKLTLMEHYSGDHMKSSLKNKFGHLNEYGICSICKFDAEEEDLLWVHIGTLHEKVNIVLKENGFKQVCDQNQAISSTKDDNEDNCDSDQIPNKDTNENDDEFEQIKEFLKTTSKVEEPATNANQTETVTKKRKKRKRSSEWCLVPVKKNKKDIDEDKNGDEDSKGDINNEDSEAEENDENDEDYVDSAKIDETPFHYEEMTESDLPCKKCNQVKNNDDHVYACSQCHQGWHQKCTIPPLVQRPKPDWLCPLCHHISLVNNLEKILKEFDSLVEELEELRRATLIENQSKVSQEEEAQNASETLQEESGTKTDKESSEEEADSDDDCLTKRSSTCTCGGRGGCLFCKRRLGCTCDGNGTCRMCRSQEVEGDLQKEEATSQGPVKMSTTEMFLLTGKTRQVEVQPHERLTPDPTARADEGFVYQGNTRGRGAKTKRGKSEKVKQTLNIGTNLPPGITILNSSGTILDRGKSGRGARTRGKSKSRGMMAKQIPNEIHPTNGNNSEIIDVIDVDSDDDIIEVDEVQTMPLMKQRLTNQGYQVTQYAATNKGQQVFQSYARQIGQPRPSGPRPIKPKVSSHIYQQHNMQTTEDIEPQQIVIRQPPNHGLRQPLQHGVVRRPVRHQIQRGGLRQPLPARGVRRLIRQPVQRGGLRQPVPRGGQVIVQNGRQNNSQMNQMNPQPRGLRPARRGPMPVRRGVPMMRGPRQVQTVIYPQQGRVQSSQQGPQYQHTQQRIPRGKGMPVQRRIISNSVRTIRPVHARGRGMPVQQQNTMMGTRPQRAMVNRGRHPVISRRPRARGRPAGNTRIVRNQNFDQSVAYYNSYESSNSFSDNDDDVIIPTINPDYQAAPDFDIIAEDDLVDYNVHDDENIMTENYAF